MKSWAGPGNEVNAPHSFPTLFQILLKCIFSSLQYCTSYISPYPSLCDHTSLWLHHTPLAALGIQCCLQSVVSVAEPSESAPVIGLLSRARAVIIPHTWFLEFGRRVVLEGDINRGGLFSTKHQTSCSSASMYYCQRKPKNRKWGRPRNNEATYHLRGCTCIISNESQQPLTWQRTFHQLNKAWTLPCSSLWKQVLWGGCGGVWCGSVQWVINRDLQALGTVGEEKRLVSTVCACMSSSVLLSV